MRRRVRMDASRTSPRKQGVYQHLRKEIVRELHERPSRLAHLYTLNGSTGSSAVNPDPAEGCQRLRRWCRRRGGTSWTAGGAVRLVMIGVGVCRSVRREEFSSIHASFKRVCESKRHGLTRFAARRFFFCVKTTDNATTGARGSAAGSGALSSAQMAWTTWTDSRCGGDRSARRRLRGLSTDGRVNMWPGDLSSGQKTRDKAHWALFSAPRCHAAFRRYRVSSGQNDLELRSEAVSGWAAPSMDNRASPDAVESGRNAVYESWLSRGSSIRPGGTQGRA